MKRSELVSTITLVGVGLGIVRAFIAVLVIQQEGVEALFGSFMVVGGILAVTITAMIYSAYRYRKLTVDVGKSLGFSETFAVMLGVYALGSFLVVVSTGVYLTSMRPDLIPAELEETFQAFNMFREWFNSVLIGSIIAVLLALVFSRLKKPFAVS